MMFLLLMFPLDLLQVMISLLYPELYNTTLVDNIELDRPKMNLNGITSSIA